MTSFLLSNISMRVLQKVFQIDLSTFKIPGGIRFGPGEENEAGFGACGSVAVSVPPMVPTGLLPYWSRMRKPQAMIKGQKVQCEYK